MTLKNPYAYVGKKLVTAAKIEDSKQDFRCPRCKKRLRLKRGPVRIAHFAHAPDVAACPSESIIHRVAIDILLRGYKFEWESSLEVHKLGGGDVRDEYSIGKYRADVAFIKNGELEYIVEVCHTNKKDDFYWEYVSQKKIRCYEVDAQSVIDAFNGVDKIIFLNTNVWECAWWEWNDLPLMERRPLVKNLRLNHPAAYAAYTATVYKEIL